FVTQFPRESPRLLHFFSMLDAALIANVAGNLKGKPRSYAMPRTERKEADMKRPSWPGRSSADVAQIADEPATKVRGCRLSAPIVQPWARPAVSSNGSTFAANARSSRCM
ncbi:hypothetical protein, partial [Caballeronia sp. LZ028]|uniref:hypothetical protein n=1 Tax=Caballeronia sp. LZ028 TaxID=3038563 RepID=UPI0028605AEF